MIRQQHIIIMQQHIIMVKHIEQQSCVWHIIIKAIIGLRLVALPDLRGARNDDMMSENAIWGRRI
ncbi:MAG: hypothetical protein JNN25_03200 [Candidatus Kapabacteria bacterium]|nr:hypothetical protein [Candidatus Kapabacteria bacterium]